MDRRSFLTRFGLAGLAGITAPERLFAVDKRRSQQSFKKLPVSSGWDVIVVGGGPSGCAAATAAARNGAKTLLIESTGVLGGMGTSGLLNAWCPFTDGERFIYQGIAKEIFLESKKGVPHAKGNNWVPINSEHLKLVYDNIVSEAGVHVLFFSSMAAVEMKSDGNVDAVIIANKAGLTAYKAKVFIDCTGDGDLATWAGAEYEFGDDSGKIQAGSLCFTVANVNTENYQSIHNRQKTSPIHRMYGNPDYPMVKARHMNDKVIAPHFIGMNAGHIEVDSTDPESLSAAMMTGRKLAAELHRGMKEFSPEAFGESMIAGTGSLMGIRESRRIKGDYVFTVEDWAARRDFEDNIGRNCYYIDLHMASSKKYPRYKKGESHGIPYRCLTPAGLSNVAVAGRCISVDGYALGSLRVMPPSMVTGEAAGTAAAIACRQGRPDFHSVDIRELQKKLTDAGQLL